MATITWRENPPVKEGLLKSPQEFDFDQAINILEQLDPNAIPLGSETDPQNEAIRIKSHVSFAIPTSELQSLQHEPDKKPILWINFLSIAGIQGPLPTPYTETIIDRTRQKDTAFRDFLDIFNHRLATLWHRLRKKIMPGVLQAPPQETPIGKTLLQLAGVAHPLLVEGKQLTPQILLSYHDVLWKRPHSGAGLLRLIKSYFNVPVVIEQFQGNWCEARAHDLGKIGSKKGQFNELGKNMILGRKCWNQTAGTNIVIGPLSWEEYCSFLPNNSPENTLSHFSLLEELSYFFSGINIQIYLCLKLNRFDIKPVILNQKFALGYNSWLKCDKIQTYNPSIKIALKQSHR
jgi:type VI secretion system protein ImpH